jgi:hypothetical protein
MKICPVRWEAMLLMWGLRFNPVVSYRDWGDATNTSRRREKFCRFRKRQRRISRRYSVEVSLLLDDYSGYFAFAIYIRRCTFGIM